MSTPPKDSPWRWCPANCEDGKRIKSRHGGNDPDTWEVTCVECSGRGWIYEEVEEHMGSRSDLVDVACTITRETDRAYLISDGVTEGWVPKSLCEWDESDKTMAMPEWLAEEKGFF